MSLSNFINSIAWKVRKDQNSNYAVVREDYKLGEKVAEYTYNFSNIGGGGAIEPQPSTGIVGVYQALHPSTYLTDTSVVDPPLDLSSNGGYKNAFANCSALTTITLESDTSFTGDSLNNEYAFYGCSSLRSVNIADKLYINRDVDPNKAKSLNFAHMFDGCVSLTNITGSIGFNGANPASIVDMFKGCTNLDCSNLIIYNGAGDSIYDLFYKYRNGSSIEIDGEIRTFTYSYELLGLTLSQLKQATIYDPDSESVIDLETLF